MMNHHKAPQHALLLHLNTLKSKLEANNYQSQLNVSQQLQYTSQLISTFQNILTSLGNRLSDLQNENNQLINKLSIYENVKPFMSNKCHVDESLINLLVMNQNDQNEFYPDTIPFNPAGIKLEYLQEELNFDQTNQPDYNSQIRNPVIKKSSKGGQNNVQNSTTNGYIYPKEPMFMNGMNSTNKLSDFVQKKIKLQNNLHSLNSLKPNGQKISAQTQSKHKFRQQCFHISKFIHGTLVHQLEKHEDHKRYLIPKKIVLKKYLQWSKANGITNLLIQRPSLIQMCLTNELKLAFKGIDCYTKSYRGLKFKKADLRDDYEKEDDDDSSGENA